ncbi:MAG: hypothetical protein ACRDQ2_07365 [Gaiellales bacterium]
MSDREIDRLFAGKSLDDEPPDELADFVREVHAAYVAPPAEAVESRQVAAMAEVARVAADGNMTVRAQATRRRRTFAFKEALMTRTRTATTAIKLAALSAVAVLATSGLAAAGLIELPNPLPGQASDRAGAVHEEIQGSDPAAEHCAFGLSVAEAASDGNGNQPSSSDACEQENGPQAEENSAAEHGKSDEARERNAGEQDDVEAQQNGAEPGDGSDFGDTVSDRAAGGEPRGGDGGDFGESVSGGAKDLVTTPEPQGGAETGETNSQEGRANAETNAQGGPETGQNTAGEHAPER